MHYLIPVAVGLYLFCGIIATVITATMLNSMVCNHWMPGYAWWKLPLLILGWPILGTEAWKKNEAKWLGIKLKVEYAREVLLRDLDVEISKLQSIRHSVSFGNFHSAESLEDLCIFNWAVANRDATTARQHPKEELD